MKSSLNIDLFFFAALAQSEALKSMVGKRIFHTFRDSTAEKEDKIPYLIVTADSATSQYTTKDDGMASLNLATCSVLCVAKNPNDLAELTTAVMEAVDTAYNGRIWREYEDWGFKVYGITPQADAIEADPDKPCLFRWLHFTCEI